VPDLGEMIQVFPPNFLDRMIKEGYAGKTIIVDSNWEVIFVLPLDEEEKLQLQAMTKSEKSIDNLPLILGIPDPGLKIRYFFPTTT